MAPITTTGKKPATFNNATRKFAVITGGLAAANLNERIKV
jgi:hypothetical protein